MLAMQYTINLPNDYDMGLIRTRVEERKKLFQDLPGLAHKSYLVNNNEKIYAPFYLWDNLAEARNFMLADLFKGVIAAFSRPRIRSWTVLERVIGNRKIAPAYALRECDTIAPEEDLSGMLAREMREQSELAKNPDLYCHLIALDPDRWELMRFSWWKDEKSCVTQTADYRQGYEVLYLSA